MEIKKIFDKIDKKKALDIKKLSENDCITVLAGVQYNIKIIDGIKGLAFVKAKDHFFNEGANVYIVGTFFPEYMKVNHIVVGGQLDLSYDGKIIRTNKITKIK